MLLHAGLDMLAGMKSAREAITHTLVAAKFHIGLEK